MILVFCASYLNIPPAIDVIEKCDGKFRVISRNPQIAKLFSELYSEDEVILLPNLFVSFSNPFSASFNASGNPSDEIFPRI